MYCIYWIFLIDNHSYLIYNLSNNHSYYRLNKIMRVLHEAKIFKSNY
jgi:hypothetical protein